ncbi:MAG: YabP/YqfC family sporulation protein [Bacilli bacterium]|nr:YabP/YqfC family sporulation protein [Bacilli bacterium]
MKIFDRLNNYINENNFKITIGINYVNVVNYTLVLDFNSNLVSIKYNNGIVDISGTNLVVNKMLKDEILVTGNIENIKLR